MNNMYDTTNCPLGSMCERCGSRIGLVVATLASDAGVLCLTLCPVCAKAARVADTPRLKVPTAVKLVAEHTQHLAGRW